MSKYYFIITLMLVQQLLGVNQTTEESNHRGIHSPLFSFFFSLDTIGALLFLNRFIVDSLQEGNFPIFDRLPGIISLNTLLCDVRVDSFLCRPNPLFCHQLYFNEQGKFSPQICHNHLVAFIATYIQRVLLVSSAKILHFPIVIDY